MSTIFLHCSIDKRAISLAAANAPKPPVVRVYSSAFYRCLQTISPLWSNVRDGGNEVPFICDRGLGYVFHSIAYPFTPTSSPFPGHGTKLIEHSREWFGLAPFEHLGPAHLSTLQRLFPSIQESTHYTPPANGESLGTLHDRCAATLARIISDVDEALASASASASSPPVSIVICSHAAPLIAMGRALTGIMPADANTEDFDTWTCGVSRFERRIEPAWSEQDKRKEMAMPKVADFSPDGLLDWRHGRGVGGGWICTANSDTAHLSGGPVRNWYVV
jgi:transcription factor C subunit 7